MPQAEMHDLIIELRSLTLGVGTFEAQFDRLQELTGRLADDVLAAAEGGRLTAGMSESLPRQPAPRQAIGLFAARSAFWRSCCSPVRCSVSPQKAALRTPSMRTIRSKRSTGRYSRSTRRSTASC